MSIFVTFIITTLKVIKMGINTIILVFCLKWNNVDKVVPIKLLLNIEIPTP